MLLPTQTSWVILAGGQASRMGGKDKGLVELNGSPLIQYVINKLSQQDVSITINANRNLDSYQAFAPVVSDSFPDYPGPLGGIHAGLKNASTDWVGFVPCDSPQISDDLVERFCSAVKEDSDILVAHDGEFKQPVFTLFHKRVLPKLEAFLERGDRKIILLYKECVTEYVDFSDSPNCFVNLNTPEELTQFGTLQ
ncbi:molybdenum cofactor guanylyltransferase [Vibrio crassostreae]|jgi:molybdopterin-guanine dinucleotide biosynthesis protein A|uniref:Molybdenum cofactor guanylyltransferase n=4 Tax=Vibrio TaxID=662 RepID=A0A0P6Z7K2_VIBSP|nr:MULTISPECIES: molybdenum cofactor guanylyltransferase MobA [Vibrio]HAH03524.1 molybdenum cofactor guanylyltransferase [Vibrio sp.]EAP96341.1 molybdopterin-guanine dinucleotide biosynthesis protein A [Vibrio splendidus 12B01]KPL93509.1 molybdopterin-guanine dinucleotide biosynthesis protein A [Vibrio splendidus]KPL99733.1 molybdopterin-guanine dinucleotide biosynthesis protein A [Vibrio splendidus]MBB1463928.1 molybdenum cofactor guanylyltransferase MobA [Vibrio sp. SG41-7]